jgi:hypothetical protein
MPHLNTFRTRWRKAAEKARYRLDNFFMRGTSAQFAVVSVIAALATLFGTLAFFVGLYSPDNQHVDGIGRKLGGGYLDAIWWSAMHILDPKHIDKDYGATWPVLVVSFAVTIIGMAIYASFIGFITTAFAGRLATLASGSQPVREAGHILILGWNDKIYGIFDLFEDYSKPVTIVVLSNHSIKEMAARMRTFRTKTKRVRPILRTGSPNALGELERMAFRDAYSIIVLQDESGADPDEEADIRTIKTLMLLSGNLPAKPPRPKMVAEILRVENVPVARIASRNGISLLCSSEVLGRMIVQSSRQPGLAIVYDRLFGFAANEIYVQPHPTTAGRSFGDILFEFPTAIPIGTSGTETRDGKPYFIQRMNPGKDYVIKASEWIILIGKDKAITHAPLPDHARETSFVAREARLFTREKILVLGWNSNLYAILQEYDTFLQPGSEITVVAQYKPTKAEHLLAEKMPRPLANATVRYVCADYALPGKLEPILAEAHSTCIIITDESSGVRDTGARTIVAVLLMQDFAERHPELRFKQIISEIASSANASLLRQSSKTDIIVSPQLISMLLAQVSQQLMLDRVYADLMNANANEIYLKPAIHYARNPADCTFADVLRGSVRRGEIAIGLKIAAEAADPAKNFGVRVNPPKSAPLALTEKDEVIVISPGGRGPSR